MEEVFIPYNTPSSKNSKINGKFFSRTVQNYLKAHGIQSFSSRKKQVIGYKTKPITFPKNELLDLFKNKTNYPLLVGFHFVRNSKRKWDFGNICQILLDLFTAFDIIEDDNTDILFPIPYKKGGKFYSYDKDNPGVYIKILNDIRE